MGGAMIYCSCLHSTSQEQEDNLKPSQGTSVLRLLLLGKHGAGKSATGNTILGKAVFESKFSDHMVTSRCRSESVSVRGKQVTVVDTPDLFSSLASAQVRQRSLKRCQELLADGFHVLLLITPIGYYTEEDRKTIEGIEAVFGPNAYTHTIVILTREDELGEDSLQDYIESHKPLKTLLEKVGGRYCTFNNKEDEEQRRELQVLRLLGMIEHLAESPGPCFVPLEMEGSGVQDYGNRATRGEGHHLCGFDPPAASHLSDIVPPACSGAPGREAMHPGSTVGPSVLDPGNCPKKRQPQITAPEWDVETPELRILLMGKRGAGKSAAGNSILGRWAFKTQFSEQRVTKTFTSHSRIWKGKKVLVIDSPEISSWKSGVSAVKKHTSPGPHAFLLVTPLGSSIKSDDKVFSIIKNIFGEKFTKFTIVLFTRKEDFKGQTLDTLIKEDKVLHDLTLKFEGRFTAFNYKAAVEEEQSQVDELLDQVESLVQRNGNKPCVFREKELLNIILLGRSGSGKSATGNTILGRPAFLSQLGAQPVTKRSQSGRTTVDWQDVLVVDTPSFSQMPDIHKDPSRLQEEVEYCLSLCEEGMKIFVLVVQLGRFTQEDQAAVEQLEAIFEDNIMRHMIVLFTRKEDLGDGDLRDYTNNTENKALKRVLKKCEGRVCAFNNKETGQKGETQVTELLTIANSLRENYGASSYSWKYLKHQLRTRILP